MLAGSGLRDDLRLAHALCEQNLSDHIVDLMGAGMI